MSSSSFGFVYNQLLSDCDLAIEPSDNEQGVAIGSELLSEQPWRSYNRWNCFALEMVNFECADYNYGNLVPSVRVESEEEIFFFDTYLNDRRDCAQTLSLWQTLVEGGREISLLAAHMPDVEMSLDQGKPQRLWYIKRLKGLRGYWGAVESWPE